MLQETLQIIANRAAECIVAFELPLRQDAGLADPRSLILLQNCCEALKFIPFLSKNA